MAAAGMRMFCRGEACCAGECVEATDNFDDASTTGWTTTGTVTEASGLMDLAEGATAIFDTASGSVSHDVAIRTDPLNTDDAAELRLRVCYTDANNFLFGQFLKFDDGGTIRATLRLGVVIGGVETWLTDTVEVDDTDAELDARGDLCLSFEPGEVQEGDSFVLGANYPSVFDDPSATWEDEGNILADDGAVASQLFGSDDISGILRVGDFGIAVPPGSTIDGVEVEIEAADNTDGTATFATVRLTYDGTTSDNRAAATVISGGAATYGFGGDTDTWGAALTWENVSDPEFGVQVQVELTGSSTGGSIDLDFIRIHAYFTTPDKRPGKLTFAYTNTGSPNNIQCVTDNAVENPAGGLKTGLHAVDGDWDFDTYTLNCTPCPCDEGGDVEPCTTCCDESFPAAAAYVVDFGAGGWTDGCVKCDEVAGEYELPPSSPCRWDYGAIGSTTGANNCLASVAPCNGAASFLTTWLLMSLVLREPDEGPPCKWYFVVTYFNTGGCASWAHYESDQIDTDQDCQTEITLTKVRSGDGVPGGLCNGDLPNTITLSAA